EINQNFDLCRLFSKEYGTFIVEIDENIEGELLGVTVSDPTISWNGHTLSLEELRSVWEKPLESVFPMKAPGVGENVYRAPEYDIRPAVSHSSVRFAKPKVVIPVFPGTNCEYDTAKAFMKAGADPKIVVLRNITSTALEESLEELKNAIDGSQIMMIPGGFSGGDEPDGSGKFITVVLRNPLISEAVENLISARDGLILGICNGFQALVKSGLLPYGHIMSEMRTDSPTLTFNTIRRHQSMMVTTRIASVKSPWLAGVNVGDLFTIPISHGEGRFVASDDLLEKLEKNGQIATQYTDREGVPTTDIRFNPNNSVLAIEGILSPDGRIFGKMGHSERTGKDIARNIPGEKDQKLFESGVKYFD
nr:phosphoribosylformylglycinamidine synthase subunit PurQ [Clostridiales bacterium]